ncbi:MAG: transcriptional regulator NrdR, partial [Caldilineaceae bacterium]|nr:transcriptional regulator NrdR [Caldilineaceae bacterium]
MRCPHCNGESHKVIDTRDTGDAIRRRRQCEVCGQRFTTYEHVAANLLVIKSDNHREPFDRQKL